MVKESQSLSYISSVFIHGLPQLDALFHHDVFIMVIVDLPVRQLKSIS